MIDKVLKWALLAYLIMIPVGCVYIFFHTDYSKVDGSVFVKIESTILLACIWPFVVMYAIKSHKEQVAKAREERRHEQAVSR